MRSMLFVPGDSPKKMGTALASGADALILDLEDSVAPSAKAAARETAAAFLAEHAGETARPALIVRVNAYDSGLTCDDIAAVMPARPDAVMLPKANGGPCIQRLHTDLSVAEARAGIEDGATGIHAIATETARAVFALGTYAGASNRLQGLAWGAEDLSAAIGASASRTPDGAFSEPFRLVRNLLLFAAAAAGVTAIDTVHVDFSDTEALRRECDHARRDGFTAKMAIHPAQVPVINEVFAPAQEEIAAARAIADAFAADPGAGVISIGGRMYDRPHLIRALNLLKRAEKT